MALALVISLASIRMKLHRASALGSGPGFDVLTTKVVRTMVFAIQAGQRGPGPNPNFDSFPRYGTTRPEVMSKGHGAPPEI